jgi:hypothetical protein
MSGLLANMPIARCTDEACFSVSTPELLARAAQGDEAAKIEYARRKYNNKMKSYYADYARRTARGEAPLPEPPPFRGIEDWDDAWLSPPERPAPKTKPERDPNALYQLAIRKVMDSSVGAFYAVYYAPGKFYPETCDNDMAVVRAHLERLKAAKTNGRRH